MAARRRITTAGPTAGRWTLARTAAALAVLLVAGLAGCGGEGGSPSAPLPPAPTPTPAAGVRNLLTTEDLFGDRSPGIVHTDYFKPLGEVRAASHRLCGTLHFAETRMTTTHPDTTWMGSGNTLFPAFSLPVVGHAGWLVPMARDLILSGRGAGGSGGSLWNVIVNPGRTWEETADAGYSRAAFPFTLTDNYVGQARNGLATFVFDGIETSSLHIQVAQETAPVGEYQRVDFSALVPIRFDPECPAGADAAVAAFERELASRLPLHRWAELPDAQRSQSISREGFAGADFSAVALLLDGLLYQQDVATRAGPHPWPEWMRHGVFSVTKTLCLGVSMFHLAQRYGDAIFDERITDYVPELADHPGWRDVTFHDTLNMVTGTVGANEGAAISPFIHARSASEKLAAIHRLPDAPAAPGTTFDYESTHSFVLSCAMNRYVQFREGPQADYWTLVREGVFDPLGIPHLPVSRSFEAGGELGPPIMGWGSYPDVDATAKLAQLLQDDGRHGGRQLLSRAKVREAMRRAGTPAYATGTASERYLHSVWTVRIDVGACTIDVPLMSGFGGNHVLMFPSGLSLVRFMDADDYEIAAATHAAEMYRSSCR